MEAKEPVEAYTRKYLDQITNVSKLSEVNDFLNMGRENRVICSLSKGPMYLAQLQRCCNAMPSGTFLPILDKMQQEGIIEVKVNGNKTYHLTPSGLTRFKAIKKRLKYLFNK